LEFNWQGGRQLVDAAIFLGIYVILKQKSKQNFSWEMVEPAGFF